MAIERDDDNEEFGDKKNLSSTLGPSIAATARLPSPFQGVAYPSQVGTYVPGAAGEYRGWYQGCAWKPEWSVYKSPRAATSQVHMGIDVFAPVGTVLVACLDGELTFDSTSDPRGLGTFSRIKFRLEGESYEVQYGHLSETIGAARSVRKGDAIGKSGCSGNAANPNCSNTAKCATNHVHVAVKNVGTGYRFDPVHFLSWNVVTVDQP